MKDWKLEPARDLGMPMNERARSLRRESGLVESGMHFLWWLALRTYLKVWHRLEIRGRENLPSGPPFACVANHTSHLDAMALAGALPGRWRDRIYPIAAGDTFFNTPAIAVFAAFVLNALPLWRRNCGAQAMQMLRERLSGDGCIYILFPEGTRARDGRLAGFKPGLGMLVAETPVPVVPCYLAGAFEALGPHQKFPRPRKLVLHIGKPMDFGAKKNEREAWTEIAATLHEAVSKLQAGAESKVCPSQ